VPDVVIAVTVVLHVDTKGTEAVMYGGDASLVVTVGCCCTAAAVAACVVVVVGSLSHIVVR
jgi:hypothetical protein